MNQGAHKGARSEPIAEELDEICRGFLVVGAGRRQYRLASTLSPRERRLPFQRFLSHNKTAGSGEESAVTSIATMGSFPRPRDRTTSSEARHGF
jgi:hypothetical protein